MPQFTTGQRVAIRMMARDASFRADAEGGLTPIRQTHDAGTGIVLGVVPDEVLCEPDEESGRLFYIAVIDGRFDGHRNDLGQLACWDFELTPLGEGGEPV